MTTLAGGKKGLKDGRGTEATFYHPTGLAFDARTETLYVADHVSNYDPFCIWTILKQR